MIFKFTEIVDTFKLEDKDLNDPKNIEGVDYHLEKLVSHFEHVIKISNNSKFVKVIQAKARLDNGWNFLLNKLKLRCLKTRNELDLNLDDFLMDN